jgi:hypothetical protein
MRKELLSLTFLTLLLIPGLSLLPSAQTSSYDWAISAYNSNLAGYSSYEVTFMNYSYINLNDSGFNYMAEMFNTPLQAKGTLTYDGVSFPICSVLVQTGLVYANGVFYLDTNLVLNVSVNGQYTLVYVIHKNPISYNPHDSFAITAYSSGNTWYFTFTTSGQVVDFPLTPIYPGYSINYSNGIITFNTVPDKTSALPYYGYMIYPSVAVEVNAPSQTSFVDANPYFVTLFQIYVNNEPYNSAWSGQNLVSADSASLSDDNGAMVGASTPPSDIAWGADEYIYTYAYHYSPYYLKYTYWFDVSYWLLGTQNGIKAFAGLNGLPLNDPANGYFVNLVTSPQQQIAVPSYTYSSPI